MTSAIFLPLSPASNFPFLTSTPARPAVSVLSDVLSTRSTRISTNRCADIDRPSCRYEARAYLIRGTSRENVGNENHRGEIARIGKKDARARESSRLRDTSNTEIRSCIKSTLGACPLCRK